MNTVVWVLMAVTTHGWVVPTLEFTSEARCVAAVQQIKAHAPRHPLAAKQAAGFCIKIEK